MRSRIVFLANGQNRYEIDGRIVSREEFDEHFPSRIADLLTSGETLPAHTRKCWPMAPSDALAVHPDQVQEATDHAKKMGVPTEFLPDGRPVLRDRGHRRDYLKAYGFFDRNGGYGDG